MLYRQRASVPTNREALHMARKATVHTLRPPVPRESDPSPGDRALWPNGLDLEMTEVKGEGFMTDSIHIVVRLDSYRDALRVFELLKTTEVLKRR